MTLKFASRSLVTGGSVAFFGGGWLAESFSDLSFKETLPSYGAGVRFLASEKHKVNLGIDYARGEDNDSWYFRIGEAFGFETDEVSDRVTPAL